MGSLHITDSPYLFPLVFALVRFGGTTRLRYTTELDSSRLTRPMLVEAAPWNAGST
jgi:hypothetical protein